MTLIARNPGVIDLDRQARAIAAANGWTLLEVPLDRRPTEAPPQGERSVLVIGEELIEPAVLRLHDEVVASRPFDDELRARCEAGSEHLLGVLERLPPRRVRGRDLVAVLLQHAPRGSLGALLTHRRVLAAGEAATILIGVAWALSDLHAAGWAGVLPTAETVAFLADGCPVIARLDTVLPYSGLAAEADRSAYLAFARSLCSTVEGGEGAVISVAIEGALAGTGWSRVVAAIVGTTEPAPVLLPQPAPVAVAFGQLAGLLRAPSAGGGSLVSDQGDDRPRWSLRVAAVFERYRPVWLARTIVNLVRRRPRLLLAAVLPMVALVAMLLALPPGPSGSDAMSGGTGAGSVEWSGAADESSPRSEAIGVVGPNTAFAS